MREGALRAPPLVREALFLARGFFGTLRLACMAQLHSAPIGLRSDPARSGEYSVAGIVEQHSPVGVMSHYSWASRVRIRRPVGRRAHTKSSTTESSKAKSPSPIARFAS